LLSVVPPHVQPFYYGIPRGAEIDLILEMSLSDRWAIEIKRKSSPSVSQGFYKEETDRLFKLLSEGGSDMAPMRQEFWGYWGCCLDKFGIRWMFNFPNQS
jgi:uncharacterized glyoxalase superfamily protein PhnB